MLNRHLARSVDDTVLNASPQVKAMIESPAQDNGRGRHAAVDAEGWLLSVVATSAGVSDRAGAKLLAISLLNALTTLKIMWADSGYDGKPLAIWMKHAAGLTLQIIKRGDKAGFQVVSRRWPVRRWGGDRSHPAPKQDQQTA